jgi:hypothetical protein
MGSREKCANLDIKKNTKESEIEKDSKLLFSSLGAEW